MSYVIGNTIDPTKPMDPLYVQTLKRDHPIACHSDIFLNCFSSCISR